MTEQIYNDVKECLGCGCEMTLKEYKDLDDYKYCYDCMNDQLDAERDAEINDRMISQDYMRKLI